MVNAINDDAGKRYRYGTAIGLNSKQFAQTNLLAPDVAAARRRGRRPARTCTPSPCAAPREATGNYANLKKDVACIVVT
ncbi:hypothetical protein EVAR_8708_1 [Eumeta japonica]|uniref:Uncharacterized protein n=1 Tax=Eumeta variegata TaxID=151549 RepID=A0A4C1TV04_EUMVA|nr:hypothetical protein EVAR_8708_1 [Eumeta japonica]